MELHPILEKDTRPNEGFWYVLGALGDCPSMRVGHSCTYIPDSSGTNGKVYIIGGANPSGPFAETNVLDLNTFSWEYIDSTGLKPRYEHSAFVPESQPTRIYIFGGAHEAGNHNDIQVLDTVAKQWTSITPGGSPPSCRTYHTAASWEDKFYVYSGGQTGSEPVGDKKVHVYDAVENMWSTLATSGDPPKPRHGHLVVATDNKLIVHGGMSGSTFYDDFHILDLQTKIWRSISQKKSQPPPRAAHGGVVVGSNLFIFGGMNKDGAMDTMFKFDLSNQKWSNIKDDGPPPACRLDYGYCSIKLVSRAVKDNQSSELKAAGQHAKDVIDQQLRKGSAGSENSDQGATASMPKDCKDGSKTTYDSSSTQTCLLFLLFGGMDTDGNIFDDCLVKRVA